jgi:hypothetical protein
VKRKKKRQCHWRCRGRHGNQSWSNDGAHLPQDLLGRRGRSPKWESLKAQIVAPLHYCIVRVVQWKERAQLPAFGRPSHGRVKVQPAASARLAQLATKAPTAHKIPPCTTPFVPYLQFCVNKPGEQNAARLWTPLQRS